jgi:hypothetical protein
VLPMFVLIFLLAEWNFDCGEEGVLQATFVSPASWILNQPDPGYI